MQEQDQQQPQMSQQAPYQPPQQPRQPQQAPYQPPQPPQPQQAPYQVQQGYQAQPAYQQQNSQQPYGYAQPAATNGVYYVSDQDKTLRLIAFIFNIISLVLACWLIIPLAWMIPMCVISWGIYKGTKANTVAFGVCTLIFMSLVGGILLLISKKDR